MQLTDTHTHLYYLEEAKDAVNRAINNGVTHLIMPCVDVQSIEPMQALAKSFPDNIRITKGLHPTEVNDDAEYLVKTIFEQLEDDKQCIAVGEIGIDLYWDKTYRSKQMQIFDMQLQKAKSWELPVVIHCREGLEETLEVLSAFPDLPCVFHCFGGSTSEAEHILSDYSNAYFGIGGVVTFKNNQLSDAVQVIPVNRILLETDSPYLAPVPYRGKQNESAYLPLIASTVAKIKNMDLEEFGNITSQNSVRLFGF
ncbi:MAG: TatD family hydrolase [Muribaculaceae bacterium]|nr:TatD family hydrolase [Muribaculaceae bacterium]